MFRPIVFLSTVLVFNLPLANAATLDDGVRAFEEKRYVEALEIFVPLANAGDIEAQRRVGEMAYGGLGIKQNFEAAFKWNELAANGGDRVAMYNLGYLYERGEGVSANRDTALEWYKKSALKNYAQAQYKLGLLYESIDKNVAQDWYEKAFRQGHMLAEQRYNSLGAELSKKREDEDSENRRIMAEIRRERRDQDIQDEQRHIQGQQQVMDALAQAVNSVANNVTQTQAQTQMIIASTQVAQHRQQEEARERQREQMMAQSSAAMAGSGREVGSGASLSAAQLESICTQSCSQQTNACKQTGAQRACYEASACVKRCFASNAPNDPHRSEWLQSAAQDERNAAQLSNAPYRFDFGHNPPTATYQPDSPSTSHACNPQIGQCVSSPAR